MPLQLVRGDTPSVGRVTITSSAVDGSLLLHRHDSVDHHSRSAAVAGSCMSLHILYEAGGSDAPAKLARLPAQRSSTDWARTGLDEDKPAEVFVFGPGVSVGAADGGGSTHLLSGPVSRSHSWLLSSAGLQQPAGRVESPRPSAAAWSAARRDHFQRNNNGADIPPRRTKTLIPQKCVLVAPQEDGICSGSSRGGQEDARNQKAAHSADMIQIK